MAHNGAASAILRRFPSLAFMGLSSIDMPDGPEPGRLLLGFYPGLERVRSFPVCCARAASGHAASAPPGVAKNFPSFMWLAM
jgi:hypothetical protein